ncbi:MAG: hypothetical protein V1837_05800 [Candidatus Woesearchaeota archaeon]
MDESKFVVSEYGSEVKYLWQGFLPLESVVVIKSGKRFEPDKAAKDKIAAYILESLKEDPKWFDGAKLRFDNFYEQGTTLFINAGWTKFSENKVMSKIPRHTMEWYPNELSVDTLQETVDGYFPLGKRGKSNIFPGFIDSYGCGTYGTKVNTAETVEDECKEETKYLFTREPFDITNARAMALIWGMSHNTTLGIYLPIKVKEAHLAPGNDEHNEIVLLPNSRENIEQLLNTGKIGEAIVFDHTIGLIEQYIKNRTDGNIKPVRVHSGLQRIIER